jgi:hypothetical protein
MAAFTLDRVARALEAGSREIPAPFHVYDEERVRRKSSTCPTKLFIGGISRHTTTKQLRDHFSQYGEVLDCIAMRAGDGRPRGFGYVTLDSPAAAQRCLYEPQLVDNRIVDVKLAVPESASSPKNGGAKQGGFNENMLSKYGYGSWLGPDVVDAQSWWPNCPPQITTGQYELGLDCLQILSQTRESGALSAGAPEFVPRSEYTSPEATPTATPTSRSGIVGQQRAPLGEITNVLKVDDQVKGLKVSGIKPSQGGLNVPGDYNRPATDAVGFAANMDSFAFCIHEDSPQEVPLPSSDGRKHDLLLSPLPSSEEAKESAPLSDDVRKGDLLLSPLPSPEEAKADILCNDGSEISEASEPSSDHGESLKEQIVPSSTSDDLPSIGSALHYSGECKRCNFFAKGRCQNGKDCSFCHFPHEVRKLTRQEKRERRDSKLQEEFTKDIEETATEQKPKSHHQLLRPESLTASLFMNDQDDDVVGDETYAYSILPGMPPVPAMKLPAPLPLPGAMDVLSHANPALPPGLLPPGLVAAPRSNVTDHSTQEFVHTSAPKTVQSSLLSTTPSSTIPPSSTRSVASQLLFTTPSAWSLPTPAAQTKSVRTIGTQTDDDYKCPRCEKRLSGSSGIFAENFAGNCCGAFNARCGGS